MNSLEELTSLLKTTPETVEFNDVINTIEQYYQYTPSLFKNGEGDNTVINQAGENEGSCKIFAFAKLNDLDNNQTLNCFGQYYRNDVLDNPDSTDHANIRNFIKYGWNGIHFETAALKKTP